MQMSPQDYMLKFIEIFKIYLAFIHFIEVVSPVRHRISRDHFSHSERELHSLYKDLMKLVSQGNDREFRKFTRLSVSAYEYLFELTQEKLQKFSQRHPIPPECRLLLTLTYLAYNSPRNLLTMAFRVGLTTLRSVIMDTVEIISTELSAVYLKQMTEDDYLILSEELANATGLPSCLGTLDAIDIKPERKQCPYVLVACSNTKYQLFNVDVAMADDMPERDNIVNQLRNESIIGLPSEMQTPGTGELISPYFVTSSLFPFVKNTMRPYPGKALRQDRQYFNEHLRVASDYGDNAFGVLLFKWNVLQSKIGGLTDVAQNIIKACVILHNFAIEHDPNYINDHLVDHIDEETMEFKGGIWRKSVNLPKSKIFAQSGNIAKREAFENRDLLKNYLRKEWQ